MIHKVGNKGERTTPTQLSSFEFKRIYNLVIENYSMGDIDKTVLDYGCGSGYGTSMLSEHFGQVYGVDVSENAINFCNSNFKSKNLNFHLLDTSVQPFEDNYFDNIISSQVFEHIPLEMVNEYLLRTWNMLKPNGVAILTTPNSKNYYGGHSGNIFHIKEYSLSELENIFKNVIPNNQYKIFGFEDVLSTQLRIKIKRFFKNRFLASKFAGFVELIVKILERYKIIKVKTNIKKKNINNVVGSFYCVIHKK